MDYSIVMRVSLVIRALSAPKHDGGVVRRAASVLLCVFMTGLAGCTATRSGVTFAGSRTVNAGNALILPAPGGPAVLSVIEQRFSNAIEQKVILSTTASTSGQNYMSIRMYGPMERETQGTKPLSYRSVSEGFLAQEARRAVPGVAMKSSGLFLRNAYGPFGYAFGQNGAGDSCLYGWQQLRTDESGRQAFRNVGAIQIRVRLCEAGVSEKALLSVMYGYTVTGGFSSDQWNPYGGPPSVERTLGETGTPIYPADTELASAPATANVTIRKARPRRVVVDDGARQREEEAAAKRLVDVPSPIGSDVTPAGQTDDGASVIVPGPDCAEGNQNCN